jgi:dipeptidyl aminopeptidase/acylaminoacyl peptidase
MHQYSIEQLMASDSFAGISFSPDDSKLLFSSTRSGAANLYTMPVDGGEARALTSSKEPLTPLGFFPHDERVLYLADSGGNELSHLFVRELDGSVRDLTPNEKARARFVDWAPDGRSFFAVTNERDPRFFDLYEYQVKGYGRRLLFKNDASYQIRAVSDDRHYVAVSRIIDNATKHAFLYDTHTHSIRDLTSGVTPIASEPQTFSRDSAGLFLTTDEGREFAYLIRLDLKTGTRKVVLQSDWDVEGASLSDDGRRLAVAVDEDAHIRMHLLDAHTLAEIPYPETGAGTTTQLVLAHHKPYAALIQSNGDTPGDVYLVDLQKGVQRRLLRSLTPQIDAADLVPGEVARFESYDGLTVPGVLYIPQGAGKDAGMPAVIWVHGGPGDESQIGYSPLLQFLTNHGYVVYAVNNRGSAGSGRTFYHLDDHRHGDADLDDIVAAKGKLIDSGYVDGARIAIAGQSYGGYMTLAALAFRPEAFAAGIDLYGVANWPRLLKSTPAWWEDLRRLLATEMGDVDKDADYLRDISPVFHAEKIIKPLLVLQGANDPRVLKIESDDIVAKVKANGVPVDYIVFPDEGHGFRKKADEIAAYQAALGFLDRYVKNAGQPDQTARLEHLRQEQ